jgi:hypothetical protein
MFDSNVEILGPNRAAPRISAAVLRYGSAEQTDNHGLCETRAYLSFTLMATTVMSRAPQQHRFGREYFRFICST